MPSKRAKNKRAADKDVEGKPIEITRLPEFASYYANSTGVMGTKFDLTLFFGRMTGKAPDGHPTVAQFAQVAMSWEHARAVYKLLGEQLLKRDASSKEDKGTGNNVH